MFKRIKVAVFASAVIWTAICLPGPAAWAAELVMFEAEWCLYCRMFTREVEPAYKASALSGKLPLRRVDINSAELKDYSLKRNITATPTFVLVEDGREISRFTGYPGTKNFFALVNRMAGQVK